MAQLLDDVFCGPNCRALLRNPILVCGDFRSRVGLDARSGFRNGAFGRFID